VKKYLIVIEEAQTGLSAYSPDLPGCVSTGGAHARLPKISGGDLVRLLVASGPLGNPRKRQSYSAAQSTLGEHNITVPNRDTAAKGTLYDILTKISLWNGVRKDELIGRLR